MSISDDEIMEVALDLFANKGYTSVSTRELAQAAGITEMTLFRRFESKKKLFIRCVFKEKDVEDFLPSIDAIPADDPREAFRLLADSLASSFSRQGRLTKVFSSCPEVNDEEFRDLARERLVNFQATIGRFLRRLDDTRQTSAMDVDIVAITLVAQISGFFFLKEVGNLSPDQSWEDIVKRCIVGYGEALRFY
jgi:AcrR family transcriptional regulator